MGSIFEWMIPTSPGGRPAGRPFLSLSGFGINLSLGIGFGFSSAEMSVRFSPLCPAALSHGAAVSQVWARRGRLLPALVRVTATCVEPRGLRGLWCHMFGLTPFSNRRAVLPGALGTPDKTAHVGAAARIKYRASDRRHFGKSPALL